MLYDTSQTVPIEATNPDHYHDADSTVSNFAEFWTKTFGGLVESLSIGVTRGLAQGLGVPESVVWIGGIALVVYLVSGKKGRR